MTFMIYGLNAHELMPLDKLFKEPAVGKTEALAAVRQIDGREHPDTSEHPGRRHAAEQAYRDVEQLPSCPPVLLAEQIMTFPIVTLTPETGIAEALRQFQDNALRHIPVVSSAGRLVGIVSDRDIFRYLAGLTESFQQQIPRSINARVEQLMTPQVLTASVDTDVRYIARLFVEQRIGAVPVVKEGVLEGIITRSDVLRAVMRHYIYELWA